MERLIFPIHFKACPNCGSERRIAGDVLEGEKEKKKVGPKVEAFLFMHQSLIADPSKPILSAPLITSVYDVCGDCGMVYCVHANVKTAVPGVGKGMPPISGMPGHN